MDVSADESHEITIALERAYAGDTHAREELWRLVYDRLSALAHARLLSERSDHTMSTADLVNEAYLRLVDHTRISWKNRSHFYALACKAMRRILVDHARKRNAEKRRAAAEAVSLEVEVPVTEMRSERLLALDEALTTLSGHDERLGQVVECRFFGGMTIEETAEILDVSTKTVERDWIRAKTYLFDALGPDA